MNWEDIGEATGVVAIASIDNRLFCATRDNKLWSREPVLTRVSWQEIGHANDVVAMTATAGKLFCATKDNRLWARDPVLAPFDWKAIGHANELVAMTASADKLFCVTTDGKLWARDPVLTNVDWQAIGDSSDVVALAAFGGELLAVTRAGKLLARSAVLTPTTWRELDVASDVVAMTALGDRLFFATRNDRLRAGVPGAGVGASSQVFRDTARRGASASFTLPAGSRYAWKRFAELSPLGLAHAISSAQLASSANAEASLFLFAGNSATIPNNDYRRMIPYNVLNSHATMPFIQDFHGDFLRLTLPAGSTPLVIDDLAQPRCSFGDRAASLMLVDRWRAGTTEQTISAATTFTFPWSAALKLLILPLVQVALGGGVAVIPMGDPVFTWAARPVGRPKLSDDDAFMVLSQQLVFHASGIGVNVWLLFYFRFAVDNGKLQLNVADLDRYVWPGTGGGEAQQAIDSGKEGILSAMQSFITPVLNFIPSHCDDVYLLPGTQPNSKATKDQSVLDDAMRDVTIVLVNPRAT